MSAIQTPDKSRTVRRRTANPTRDNRFYFVMSLACAVGIFFGFARTYYLKTYFATPTLSPLFHIHGAVFSAWVIFFVVQTALIADTRVKLHRRLGYAGAALASAMIVLGIAAALSAAKAGFFRPIPLARNPEGALFFSLVSLMNFVIFVGAGFYFRRNRPMHQRLMLMSTACALMPIALSRLPAEAHYVAVMFAFTLAGPVYDLVTLRRIHRAYLWSLSLFFITLPPLRMLVGNSAAWYRVAHWLLS
ncbi:MAG: hypothetical protein M3Y72_09230 [Acidobacteriota bacterium]|nr:hypothetical protein [Acidobacteriota bacterium]